MATDFEFTARLLAPYIAASPGPDNLRPEIVGGVVSHLDLLQKWNAQISLTAIKGEGEIVMRHFGESLFAARVLLHGAQYGRSVVRFADLGSGAGFPGMPLALYAEWSGITLDATLIESNQKKATFLREVARALTLPGVRVAATRASTFGAGGAAAGSFDLVTMRAVERFEEALPVAVALCAPGGKLGILIGAAQMERARELVPSVVWDSPVAIPQSRDRVLLVGKIGR